VSAAAARALDAAVDLSFSAFGAIHASNRAHATLADSLCKTKARASPTVNTDCNTCCDCVIAVDVYVDVAVVVHVTVQEGDKYKIMGGTCAAV
jgi:hypothetical protein